jgi:hypothetical protein
MFGAVVLALTAAAAEAGKCGKAACTGCQPCGEKPSCGVEIQYEAHEVTEYKTVYEEVKEVKEIDAVKYVPETELRDAPCTVCKPQPAAPCGPPAGCCEEAKCGQPCTSCCQEAGIRKVPVTVYRAVPIKKPFETTRLVEKKIPFTYTCYVPKPVCCAPPQGCAPAPSCTK